MPYMLLLLVFLLLMGGLHEWGKAHALREKGFPSYAEFYRALMQKDHPLHHRAVVFQHYWKRK